jgi:HEPN domain-containing protein
MPLDERTQPIALFIRAQSFSDAARTLIKAGPPNDPYLWPPIGFLFFHSIELYLKAFLRLCGLTVDELTKLRHGLQRLAEEAKQRGLEITEHDMAVCEIVDDNDAMIRARYVETGSYRLPTNEALDETCQRLNATVHAALDKAGVSPRLRGKVS